MYERKVFNENFDLSEDDTVSNASGAHDSQVRIMDLPHYQKQL